MSDFQYLAQWAEPDGDNDELGNIRLDIRTLLSEYRKSKKKLDAAKSVMWMAHVYATSGLPRPVMGVPDPIVELNDVMEILKS